MALLGSWIDKTSLQTLGGTAGGDTFQTVAHAVASSGGQSGSTNPDTGIIVVRSMQSLTAPGLPYWFGANASIATLGYAVGTIAGASRGFASVDVFNIFFWSAIR